MFGFVERIFVFTVMFFSCSLSSINPLDCVLIDNQESKVRPKIANVNSSKPVFYPFSIETSKYSGSCNNINYPKIKIVCS